MLDPKEPLFLPKGSVRALLALAMTVAYFVGAVNEQVLLLVLGSYFVGRAATNSSDS